jgi:hypothetical protein
VTNNVELFFRMVGLRAKAKQNVYLMSHVLAVTNQVPIA